MDLFRNSPVDVPDSVCRLLEVYFTKAVTLCGMKLFLNLLLEDEDPLSDFEEDIQDLRLKGHETVIQSSLQLLQEKVDRRIGAKSMLQVAALYKLEDISVRNVLVAFAEYYNFQLQPFIHSREISYFQIKSLKSAIKDPDIGNRRKEEFRDKIVQLEDTFYSSTSAIYHLYQEFYRKNLKILTEVKDRVTEDSSRFGLSSFKSQGGQDRLRRLEIEVLEESIKLLNTVKASQEFQFDSIKSTTEGCQCRRQTGRGRDHMSSL